MRTALFLLIALGIAASAAAQHLQAGIRLGKTYWEIAFIDDILSSAAQEVFVRKEIKNWAIELNLAHYEDKTNDEWTVYTSQYSSTHYVINKSFNSFGHTIALQYNVLGKVAGRFKNYVGVKTGAVTEFTKERTSSYSSSETTTSNSKDVSWIAGLTDLLTFSVNKDIYLNVAAHYTVQPSPFFSSFAPSRGGSVDNWGFSIGASYNIQ